MHKLLKNTGIKGPIFYNVWGWGGRGFQKRVVYQNFTPPPPPPNNYRWKLYPPWQYPPSPISGVISKVQCQRQKRVKEWHYQGGYKQWARCVPFRLANSGIIKCHQYQLRPCVCAKLPESSISHLSRSFVKELTQLCMLTQDKSTKSDESYIYSGHG